MRYSKSDRDSDHRKRLTTELIRRVQADEDEAILELLSIFESKIRYFSRMDFLTNLGLPLSYTTKTILGSWRTSWCMRSKR